MRALGTIVNMYEGIDRSNVIECRFLDYYDHWSEIDPRMALHHGALSPAANALGHDIVHQATYVHEILKRLPSGDHLDAPAVVTVGSMTEAFLVSVRSAYDAVADGLGYVAASKPGQAPRNSLNDLTRWAGRNDHRVQPQAASAIHKVPPQFLELRSLRDEVVHQGADLVIHTDRKQFNLWARGPKGWITREPLLPFLARHFDALLTFADEAAVAINEVVDLPKERIGSRAVEGVFVSSLHRLRSIQHQYASASP